MPIVSYSAKEAVEGVWGIYAIICEVSDSDFVIKIGVSSTPFQRYEVLCPGIPFNSVMLFSPTVSRAKAYKLEAMLHKHFAARNTRGEWFRFTLAEKAEFHTWMKRHYFAVVNKELKWQEITLENLRQYRRLCEGKKARAKKTRAAELHDYRHGQPPKRKWSE